MSKVSAGRAVLSSKAIVVAIALASVVTALAMSPSAMSAPLVVDPTPTSESEEPTTTSPAATTTVAPTTSVSPTSTVTPSTSVEATIAPTTSTPTTSAPPTSAPPSTTAPSTALPTTTTTTGPPVGAAAVPGQAWAYSWPMSHATLLTWDQPFDGGSPILRYHVQQQSRVDLSRWVPIATTTGRSHLVTGLTNNVTYYFRVAAENADGIGEFFVFSAWVNPAGRPEAVWPQARDSAIRVEWIRPMFPQIVSSYRIERRLAGSSTWTYVKTIQATDQYEYGYTVTGLQNGTRYYIRVGAVYLNSEVEWAPAVTAVPRRVPDAVRSAFAVAGLEEIGVAWRAPLFNGGASVTGYRVYTSLDGVRYREVAAEVFTLSDGRSAAIVDAPAGRRTWIQVRALNAAGAGATAPAVSAVPFTYPDPPRNLRGAPGSGSISLSWQTPVSNGGVAIGGYEIQISAWGTDVWRTVGTTSASQLRFTVPGLRNGTRYCVRVASVNTQDYGHWAVPIAFYAGSWRSYDPYGQGCYR